MAAGARAGDAEMVRVHAVFASIMANETNGAENILFDLGDVEFGLRPMHDGENRVAMVQERLVQGRGNHLMIRDPAAADQENDSEAVCFSGLQDIERERGAEL